ncbi:unnamed protein product [Lactuca virosa]|uniref:PGR5-like protein 1B, chloroplastic n=1 Tax=Lactuca virosa TaxID=75947 RepID=A0AAU9N132_9ASTR|nr:unnamed protein product [Lactuca virosa]
MATGTSANVPTPHVIGSTVVELSRNSRTLAPSPLVRISCKNSSNNGLSIRSSHIRQSSSKAFLEGPSCLFVGPIESASQETLEALYRQARDAYYSGKPLIVDDMFDRVELKLRWYGSKYVVKYPRCSLRQHSTYADAEGRKILLSSQALELIAMMNGMLVMMLGSMIGYPVASAAVGALKGLWKNDLVAIKGACPNCGEEVFAFVKSNQFSNSPHKAECHVCECLLEFRTKVEKSIASPGKRWVYGRIYLIRRRRTNRGQRWT